MSYINQRNYKEGNNRDKINNQVKINPHVKTLVNDIKSRLLKY